MFYVPFTIFFCFIVLHMVVALIMESYQVHQSNRVRLVVSFHLSIRLYDSFFFLFFSRSPSVSLPHHGISPSPRVKSCSPSSKIFFHPAHPLSFSSPFSSWNLIKSTSLIVFAYSKICLASRAFLFPSLIVESYQVHLSTRVRLVVSFSLSLSLSLALFL